MKLLCDKILIVSRLCKYAENGVFAPNISALDNKCVVFNIVCWLFSAATHTSWPGVPGAIQ